MSFGVTDPTHMSFSMTFSDKTEDSAITLVVNKLMEDGWKVSYDPYTRNLAAQAQIETIKPPTIVQGPPDYEYLAQRAWKSYAVAVGGLSFEDKPLPDWSQLGDRQKAGWIAAIKAVAPCP